MSSGSTIRRLARGHVQVPRVAALERRVHADGDAIESDPHQARMGLPAVQQRREHAADRPPEQVVVRFRDEDHARRVRGRPLRSRRAVRVIARVERHDVDRHDPAQHRDLGRGEAAPGCTRRSNEPADPRTRMPASRGARVPRPRSSLRRGHDLQVSVGARGVEAEQRDPRVAPHVPFLLESRHRVRPGRTGRRSRTIRPR